MKIILLISLLSLVSCTTYLRTSGSRMISPEANGKLWKGSIDLVQVKGTKQYQMDFGGSSTKGPLNDDANVYGAGLYGDLGLWTRLDVFIIPSFVMTPTLFGAKFQVLGDPRLEAKKGNFSLSVAAASGSRSDNRDDAESDSDIFDGGVDKISVQMSHREVGLIVGYRWQDWLLHYGNAYFYEEEVRGKVTNNSGTLSDAKYKYRNNGAIYSTGLIFYPNTSFHFKLEYSHLTTDWTYNHKSASNLINGAIGFHW